MNKLNGYNLKICPRLNYDDVYPKRYQKMNVGRAYRVSHLFLYIYLHLILFLKFFNEKTKVAMDVYKNNNHDLEDCFPSVILIDKV